MPLLSAIDDFAQRSLGALPTLWEKLRFVVSLREDGTTYRHWGLQQKYGDNAAHSAIAAAHLELVEKMASTRIAELWLAADQVARREERQVSQFLEELNSQKAQPEGLHGVAPEHIDFVLANLSRVARSRSLSSH